MINFKMDTPPTAVMLSPVCSLSVASDSIISANKRILFARARWDFRASATRWLCDAIPPHAHSGKESSAGVPWGGRTSCVHGVHCCWARVTVYRWNPYRVPVRYPLKYSDVHGSRSRLARCHATSK